MAKCCANCFNDKLITAYIEKEFEEHGNCSFCGSENVKLVESESLIDLFETLLNIYQETDNAQAQPIYKLIQKDWNIFYNAEIAEQLMPKIINYTYMKTYGYLNIDENFVKNIWDEFRNEIKHNNRFFPKSTNFDMQELKAWLQELELNKYPKILYRARISNDKSLIDISKMGKPSSNIATSGRANPYGISYLYMATTKTTAIAEVRPHKGNVVCIAKIKIPNRLRLADLRNPKTHLSPFLRSDYSTEKLFKYIVLLQKLGEELSKPIVPHEAELEYLSSQYLAELIKDANFDGIIFKSSVGKGDNITLFNDSNVEFKNVELYEVNNLSFDSSKI